ncbi:MAG: glycosyltransferase [bacterium]|nr:MAG: glycosyltransferase [bacterium]
MTGRGVTSDRERYHLLFFGGYLPSYSRNAIIRKGWRALGLPISECRADTRRKVHLRYPALLWRYLRAGERGRILFVPDFRHKDVPLAWVLARLSGKRLVFDPLVSRYETRVLDRGDATEGSPQAWHNRNIDRLSFTLPDLVLADTEAHARFFIGEYGISPEKVYPLPVGFDEDVFPQQPEREGGGAFRVLFYGSYLPLHGIEAIIDAASLLRDRHMEFTLVGSGQTYEEIRNRARHLDTGTVTFRGYVPERELCPLIAASDVVLGIFGTTPKAAMVIPNKVYQSLAVGRAVVTADTPAIREHFIHGVHLMTVPNADPGALAGCLRDLQDNPGLRRRLAAEGGSYVRKHFCSARIAERLASILEEAGLL